MLCVYKSVSSCDGDIRQQVIEKSLRQMFLLAWITAIIYWWSLTSHPPLHESQRVHWKTEIVLIYDAAL